MQMERWELAEEALLRAIRVAEGERQDDRLTTDESISASAALGRVYIELARLLHDPDYYEDAIDATTRGLRAVTQKNPNYARLHLTRGYAFYGLGRWSAAKQDLTAALLAASNSSIEYNTARRNLRRLNRQRDVAPPPWLPYLISGIALLLVPYALINGDGSVSTVAAASFGALLMVIAGFSVPVLTKLKVGAVELEKQSTVAEAREMLVSPERRPEFAMVHDPKDLASRLVRSRREAGKRVPVGTDAKGSTTEPKGSGAGEQTGATSPYGEDGNVKK